jgi:hypothetical protein
MKTYLIAAAAAAFALAIPASAQMAAETAKTGTTMQTETAKPMVGGSMAMSGDAKMDGSMMAKKPVKKNSAMMADKPMMGDKPKTEDQMKSDSMKH